MDPATREKIREEEIKMAIFASKVFITPDYLRYKRRTLNTFNDEYDSYLSKIKDANLTIVVASSGATTIALFKYINSIVQDSYKAGLGVHSIVKDSNTAGPASDPTIVQGHIISGSKIKLEDDFLNAKKSLKQALDHLEKLRVLNNKLSGDLEGLYNGNINRISAPFSVLTRPETEAIAGSLGKRPLDNINMESVAKSQSYVYTAINQIEDTIPKIQKAYDNLHNADDESAVTFGDFIGGIFDGLDEIDLPDPLKKIFKIGGKVFTVIDSLITGIKTYSDDTKGGRDKTGAAVHGISKAAAGIAGGKAGAILGAKGGAIVGGAIAGPVGAGIGAVVGGIAGAIAGAWGAEEAVDIADEEIQKEQKKNKSKEKKDNGSQNIPGLNPAQNPNLIDPN